MQLRAISFICSGLLWPPLPKWGIIWPLWGYTGGFMGRMWVIASAVPGVPVTDNHPVVLSL